MVDCDKTNDGCDGGFSSSAFEYVISNKGLDTEEYYPYTAGYFNNKKNDDNRCKYSTDHIGASIVKYVNVTRGDEAALKVANYNLGAITVSIYADTKSFRYYKSGVLVERTAKMVISIWTMQYVSLVMALKMDKIIGSLRTHGVSSCNKNLYN